MENAVPARDLSSISALEAWSIARRNNPVESWEVDIWIAYEVEHRRLELRFPGTLAPEAAANLTARKFEVIEQDDGETVVSWRHAIANALREQDELTQGHIPMKTAPARSPFGYASTLPGLGDIRRQG